MGKQATIDVVINNEEAKRRFDELQKDLIKIKTLRDEAFSKGDITAFKVYDKELKDLSKEMKQFKANTNEVENALKNINKISANDLENAFKKARAEMKATARDADDYTSKKANFTKLREELDKVTGSAKSQGSWISKAGDGFNRYFGMATAAIASFTGVFLGLKQTITDYNDYQSKVANLSALTGLKGAELDWISQKAKDMSVSITEEGVRITQGADVIVDAFTKMGSAKPELLKDKEGLAEVTKEAIILSEAANMELAPAVDGLALTMNQYGAGAKDAARYVNVLAAGSKEGAAEIPDITASIVKFGAAAKTANVSVEQSVGLIEALSEKGIKGEIAGTGIKAMLVKMMSGADEFNPKVVGMSQALDNLGKANLSAGALTKMFGLENFTVVKSLIDSRGRVDELTKAVTGTNVAYEQANINTDTNAAKLEQQKNKIKLISIELGEKLAPIMRSSLGIFTKFMQLIIASINFYAEHSKAINSTVAVFTAYIIVIKANIFWTALKTKTSAEAGKATLVESAALKLHTVWLTVSTAATKLFAVAKALLTGNTNAAKVAWNAFSKSLGMGPYSMVIIAVMAIGAALLNMNKHTQTASARMRKWSEDNADAYKKLVTTEDRMNRLSNTLQKINVSEKEHAAGLQNSNFQIGKNNDLVSLSNSSKDQQTKIDNERRIALEEYNKIAIENNLLTVENNGNLEKQNKTMAANLFLMESRITVGIIEDEINQGLVEKRKIQSTLASGAGAGVESVLIEASAAIDKKIENLRAEAKAYTDANAAIEYEVKRQAMLRKQRENEEIAETNKQKNVPENNGEKDKKAKEWKLEDDKAYNAERLAIQKERRDDIIKTDEELNQQLLDLEIYFLKKRFNTQKLSADERSKLDAQIVEKEIIRNNNFNKKKEELTKKDIEEIEKLNEKALTDLQIRNNTEFASITSLEQAKALLKDTMSAEELAKITNVYDAKKALREKYDKDEQKLAIDQMAKLIDIFQKVSKDGFVNDINLGKMLLTPEQEADLKVKLAKLQEEFAKLQAAANQGEAPDKKKKTDVKELKTASVDVFGFSPDDWETLFTNLENGKIGVAEIAMAANVLVDVWKSYDQILKQQEEKELAKYVKSQEKKKTTLSKRLAQGRVSEESYAASVQAMDDETERKKAKIARDQAVRERNIALMSAIVNTSAAMVQAFVKPGGALGIALSAAIGIAGGIQIGKIMDTPLPELPGAESGGTMMDVIRSQDGKRFTAQNDPTKRGFVSSPTIITGENGDEYIMPEEALNNPSIRNLVNFIEKARLNGSLSRINLPMIQQISGKQSGGYASSNNSSIKELKTETTIYQNQTTQLNEFIDVMKMVKDVLSKPIKAETYLRGKGGFYEAQKEDNQLKKNATL